MRWLVAALLMGLFLCTPAMAQTCQFSLGQEKAKWTEQGLSIGEADPAQVVKVKNGCPHSILVMSVGDYREMIQAVSL